jgi:hypothetical protein
MKRDTFLHLVLSLRMREALASRPLYAVIASVEAQV